MSSQYSMTRGVRILCPPNKPKQEDLLRLVEARREMMKPHLAGFLLLKLGDFRCLNEGVGEPKMLEGFPISQTQGSELEIRGIFGKGLSEVAVENDRKECYVWGLTRSAEWMIAVITYST